MFNNVIKIFDFLFKEKEPDKDPSEVINTTKKW